MTHIFGFERSQLLLLPEAVDDYVGVYNPVLLILNPAVGLGRGLIFPFSQARVVASEGHKAWRRAQQAALKLAIAAIAIQLAKTHKFVAERSSENGIFVDFGARIHINKRKLLLTGVIVRGHGSAAPASWDWPITAPSRWP
jgi:hypothetical protein